MRERHTEREAGSMQGAWHGTQSQVSRIRPWAKGGAKLLSHPGCPLNSNLPEFSWILNIQCVDSHLNFQKENEEPSSSDIFIFLPPPCLPFIPIKVNSPRNLGIMKMLPKCYILPLHNSTRDLHQISNTAIFNFWKPIYWCINDIQ